MTEITERFFQEITSRVGYFRVVEIHLFPPIRQSGQESGIAVIAAKPESAQAQDGRERHVVYTARYRQTLKGPDRGKWEFDLKAEADAPLITIDEVVRGVVRRSGDDVHPERISKEQFREIVPRPEGEEEPVDELVSEGESEVDGENAVVAELAEGEVIHDEIEDDASEDVEASEDDEVEDDLEDEDIDEAAEDDEDVDEDDIEASAEEDEDSEIDESDDDEFADEIDAESEDEIEDEIEVSDVESLSEDDTVAELDPEDGDASEGDNPYAESDDDDVRAETISSERE